MPAVVTTWSAKTQRLVPDRKEFIGGSDARIIVGSDEAALIRLWREKRGQAVRPDFSDTLVVQLGLATEPLNRRWYEQSTGRSSKTSRAGFGIQ